MKKILLLTTILSQILSTSVSAQSCENSGELAYQACNQLGMYKNMCQKTVGTNHADEAAVRVCMTIQNMPDNIMYDCIRSTVNKTFSQAEINKCMKVNSFTRTSCIMNNGRAFIPQVSNYNTGDLAYQACEDTNMYERMCKKAIGSNHADEAAVRVCQTIGNMPDNIKYDCLRSTVNKEFSRKEIETCMKKNSFTRTSCIMNSGKAIVINSCY